MSDKKEGSRMSLDDLMVTTPKPERMPVEAVQIRPKPDRKAMTNYPVVYKVDTSKEGLSFLVGAQEDVPLSTIALWAEESLSYDRGLSVTSISLMPMKSVGLPKGV